MLHCQMTRRAFAFAGALALAGCAGTPRAEEPATNSPTAAKADETNQDATQDEPAAADAAQGRILVVYYSRAGENYGSGGTEWLEVGHTKVMAGYLIEELGADSYEIVPKEPYPDGYDECCDVALAEQADDARPPIASELPDVSGYDTVFIGCPIWWGDEPMIVRTFLDEVDLSGKTIYPFTTHGGSGLGNVVTNLKAALPDAVFCEGLAVAGTDVDGARERVVAWASSALA